MIIPLRLLWGLRVNRTQTLALVVIFSLVVIVIVFAIVRVVEISPSSGYVDPIWLVLWSMTEGSVGKLLKAHMKNEKVANIQLCCSIQQQLSLPVYRLFKSCSQLTRTRPRPPFITAVCFLGFGINKKWTLV